MFNRLPAASLAFAVCLSSAPAALAQPTLELRDYVVTPMTGLVDGKGSNELLLSRVNTLREEVGGAKRVFISDLNGPLYILDKESKKFLVYLNFNGNEGKAGIFRKLTIQQGYGNGLNGFYLDPDYTRNGKFYTTHIEDPAMPGSNLPDNSKVPTLNVSGYTTTAAIKTPGPLQNEGVLVEWTDSNPSNSTFEGTARELLRVQLNTRSHPLGDLIFNPAARRGDPDWRVLYLECGDGASGESTNVAIRPNPQRLDNLEGKILRIIPDLNEHVASSTVSENGRYRIPNDNPFVATPGARKEIWAYGFRNPHRLNWAVDPANPANNRLIANSVGLRTWETAYIVHKGANYGYALREGNELLKPDNTTAPLPAVDKIPLQVGEHADRDAADPDLPGHPVRTRSERRRLDRQRLRLQRQDDSGASRQVRLHRSHDRPHLVRRLQGHARRRRWQARHDGGAARGAAALERSARFAGRRQEGLRLDVSDRRGGLPCARRQEPEAAGTGRPRHEGPRGRPVFDRREWRAVPLQQGRRHHPRGGRSDWVLRTEWVHT